MFRIGREGLAERLGGKRFVLGLLIILVLGAVLQSLVAVYFWAQADEGAYLQASLAVSHGAIPLVSFPSRPEPVLLVLMAPLVYVFGAGLLVGRALMVTFNLFTAIVLAGLTRRVARVHRDTAAWAAAGIYLLLPWAAMQGATILEESAAAFFVAVSLYFLLRDRWARLPWNLPLSGLFLGVAILSRRSAVAVGVVWLAWILYTEVGWRHRIVTVVKCFGPGVLLVWGYLAYVIRETSLSWAIISVSTASAQFAPAPPWQGKVGILAYILLCAAALFLPVIALALRELRETGHPFGATLALVLSVAVVTPLLVTYPYILQWGLGELLTTHLTWVILVTLVLWLALAVREGIPGGKGPPVDGDIYLLLFGWGVAFLALDFMARPKAFGVYFTDATAPLAILFGIWFTTLIPPAVPERERVRPRRARIRAGLVRWGAPLGLTFLLVTSSAAVAVLWLGPSNPDNVPGANGLPSLTIYRYPPSEITQVGSYLDHAMGPGDRVFTFDTLFVDEAGRTISPQIAQYLDNYLEYLRNHGNLSVTPYPGSPGGFLPSVTALLSYWNSTSLPWFVDGELTTQALESSPLLAWYVNTYYHPVTSFGDPLSFDVVVIYHRGPSPAPQASLVASTPAPSAPSAVISHAGVVYAASLNSSQITYLRPDGTRGNLSILFPGARALGAFFGDLWIGSTYTSQVEILPFNGSSPSLVGGPLAPTAFAADESTGTVFVSGFLNGSVTAIGTLPGKVGWQDLWTTDIGSSVTGLAVNSTSGLVYAALPYENAIKVLKEGNGESYSVQGVPFAPYALVYADGGLVATWWNQGFVYRLSLGSGGNPHVAGKLYVGGALTSAEWEPPLDSVALASSGTVIFLRADTLLHLGTFAGFPCASALTVSWPQEEMGVLNDCNATVSIWNLPPTGNLTLHTYPGSTIVVNEDPLATFNATTSVLEIPLWPQVVSLSITIPGALPGYLEVALTGGDLAVELDPGPSLSGIHQLQTNFTVEVVVSSFFAWVGLVILLYWGSRREGDGEAPAPSYPARDPESVDREGRAT